MQRDLMQLLHLLRGFRSIACHIFSRATHFLNSSYNLVERRILLLIQRAGLFGR